MDAVLLVRRRKEAEYQRQKHISICPSDDEQTEAFRIAAAHMVEDLG